MNRIGRIVKRRTMKQELADLKVYVRVCKPLMEANASLQKAYQAGVIHGMEKTKIELDDSLLVKQEQKADNP